MHYKHVENLKAKLKDYGFNAFAEGVAKCITIGEAIEEGIISGLLTASSIGNERFKEFVQERLIDGKVQPYLYYLITWN